MLQYLCLLILYELVCEFPAVCVCLGADRVLEAKEHQLYLVDGGGVEVQVQLELGDSGRHDASLWGMDEVSKDADDLLNVFDGQLELLTALHTHTQRHTHSVTYRSLLSPEKYM